MIKKIKIVFILPTLYAGGAERVISFISQNLDKNKFDASLVVIGFEKDSKYKISDIPVYFLEKSRVLFAVLSIVRHLRNNKPDIVLSSISHLNSLMSLISLLFKNTLFIGREANVLSILKDYKTASFRFGNALSPSKTYQRLHLIICQSIDMYNDMHENFNIPKKKLIVINNPITDNFILKENKSFKKEKVQFITVAAFKKQKGHERILNILSKLEIPFHYTMIGKGAEQDYLHKLIEKLGLKDNITHIPHTNDVSKFLAQSDFFLQGSYVEGFPNCLLESCAVGTPVLAYIAPGGLDEIIEPGLNGLLAKTDEEFKQNLLHALHGIVWDPERIRASVFNKYNKEKIIKQYEDLFMNVLNKN